ncbi:SMP-30/gluconolactonase/LRE family protein [Mycobacterium sp. NPDC003449]
MRSRVVTTDWRAFGPALELGEGARLVDDRLLLVDLLRGRLYGADRSGGDLSPVGSLAVPLGAVAPIAGAPGQLIAAAGNGIALLDSDFAPHWVATLGDDAMVPVRMNDGACDPAGRFWAGMMAYEPTPAAGALYRVDPDLTVTRVVEGVAIPNGPAFDAAGAVMYLADSAAGLIYRYSVGADGELSGRDEFANVDGSPDGMTVDAESHLWSAIWGAGEIHRYSPSGRLVEVVPVPARQPTSIAIGGGRIVVTSATHGLDSPGPHDGRTFVADCAVEGLPTAAFQRR